MPRHALNRYYLDIYAVHRAEASGWTLAILNDHIHFFPSGVDGPPVQPPAAPFAKSTGVTAAPTASAPLPADSSITPMKGSDDAMPELIPQVVQLFGSLTLTLFSSLQIRVEDLNERQQGLLRDFMRRTQLNAQAATDCLSQCNWDFATAMLSFNEHKVFTPFSYLSQHSFICRPISHHLPSTCNKGVFSPFSSSSSPLLVPFQRCRSLCQNHVPVLGSPLRHPRQGQKKNRSLLWFHNDVNKYGLIILCQYESAAVKLLGRIFFIFCFVQVV